MSLETKEDLILSVREWVKIDSEIAAFKTEIKNRIAKKKMLTDRLVTVMKKNEIECFDINGGALVYKKSTVKKAINGKTLLEALQNYYKNDVNMAHDLTKHILDSRQEQVKETIKRKIDK